MSNAQYRNDIDGLRAVAILSVIAFHMSSTLLPGGYLGVDVFFVLSGFLITSILERELSANDFSIWRFYERRIRRILPALLMMLIVVSGFALLILLPADLISYGKSVLATLSFSANINFWLETGYFGRSAEEKPLLHMWSLGVEEQFYVLFPVLLWLIYKFSKNSKLAVVLLITVASFGVNYFLNKIGAANPSFFLLPPRVWELGAGALLALLPQQNALKSYVSNTLAVAGVGLIAFALTRTGAIYNTFPPAFPAVLGTCFCIFAGSQSQPLVNRLLSLKPAVFVGQISYSLYIWHWPVLVFMHYYLVRELSLAENHIALMLIFALGFASWRWIEQPFRSREMSVQKLLKWSAGGALISVVLSGLMIFTSGLPSRLPAEAAKINKSVGQNFRCAIKDAQLFGASRACWLGEPAANIEKASVILFGNSHAQMYAPLVRELAQERYVGAALVPMSGCFPTVIANTDVNCLNMARTNLEEILKLEAAEVVVIALNWPKATASLVDENNQTISGKTEDIIVRSIDHLIKRIEDTGRRVALIGPIAIPGWDVASIVSRERAFGWPQSRDSFEAIQVFKSNYAVAISHFTESLGSRFIRPDNVLCDEHVCHFILEGSAMFADSNHIAKGELFRFKKQFMPLQDLF